MTMGRKIYMANVGDSRGIVIKSLAELPANTADPAAAGNNCGCQALTRDHKPDDEDEA